jgi:hypothetical protein
MIGFFERIPYATEQGKFSAERGIDLSEQGILIRHQRTLHRLPAAIAEGPSIVAARIKESSPNRVLRPTVGKAAGDQKTEAEGKAEKAAGKFQNAVGSMKDTVRRPSKGES